MRALRLMGWKPDPVLAGVADPSGPGQVVIRAGGAGARRCGLHLMRDFEAGHLGWGPPAPAGLPAGEITGCAVIVPATR